MKTNTEILTVNQAAAICGVSRTSVWRWVKSGALKSGATAGGHHRIYRVDLFEFIKQKKMDNRIRGDSDKQRILIVDDDRQIIAFLQGLFTREGYESDYASDGFESGLKVVKFKPHLILLDLFMPKMDGFEVCESLRKDPETVDIKIIAISGLDTIENRQRIIRCGADLFLPKPIDMKILKTEIDCLLS
jgi:excisionase family DNA binding protein